MSAELLPLDFDDSTKADERLSLHLLADTSEYPSYAINLRKDQARGIQGDNVGH